MNDIADTSVCCVAALTSPSLARPNPSEKQDIRQDAQRDQCIAAFGPYLYGVAYLMLTEGDRIHKLECA